MAVIAAGDADQLTAVVQSIIGPVAGTLQKDLVVAVGLEDEVTPAVLDDTGQKFVPSFATVGRGWEQGAS